ncbi:helix-turn-helix domain-containing protein [Candidatus Woesearchaeota archaeon]|nr:helix-turn-helix domain-containing protein [Candidatus Woesearchaeota archaeon]
MWVAKFKIWHKNCLIRPRCVKYKVTDFVYLINSWTEKNKFYYTELHILQGKEENKKKFIRDLKKEESIKKLEQEGNHIFTLNEEPAEKQYFSPVFDPKIIQVKPVAQRTDGYEDWELACWDKETLMKIMDVPVFKVELKFIQNIKLGDIFLPHIYPKLSPKQREAVELAVKEGYYEYPRKIDLETLGKISRVKRQTYQENLRRAERKLIPFLIESSA